MNRVKTMALYAFVALGLTACAVEDNSTRPAVYAQTENFSPAAETRVVTLDDVVGQAEVAAADADWVTVTALPNNGTAPTQVEITVLENTSGAERTAQQVIKVSANTVNLTINQGITNVDDPNEAVTDQPAYAPGK